VTGTEVWLVVSSVQHEEAVKTDRLAGMSEDHRPSTPIWMALEVRWCVGEVLDTDRLV